MRHLFLYILSKPYCPVANHDVKSALGNRPMTNQKRNRNKPQVINEIHFRHLTVDEALLKLDKYLNDAFMAGLYRVRLIHGKGTGTLRQTIRKELINHSLVKSYRAGGYGEGGAGVTIVELVHRY
jgi:dsDNA-specific endonuclease/ATPase MutS2